KGRIAGFERVPRLPQHGPPEEARDAWELPRGRSGRWWRGSLAGCAGNKRPTLADPRRCMVGWDEYLARDLDWIGAVELHTAGGETIGRGRLSSTDWKRRIDAWSTPK